MLFSKRSVAIVDGRMNCWRAGRGCVLNVDAGGGSLVDWVGVGAGVRLQLGGREGGRGGGAGVGMSQNWTRRSMSPAPCETSGPPTVSARADSIRRSNVSRPARADRIKTIAVFISTITK